MVRFLLPVLFVLGAVVGGARPISPAVAALTPLAEPLPYSLRWRIGVGVSHTNPLVFAWPANRPGWFHDWDIDIFTPAGGYHYPLPRLTLEGDERMLGMTFVPLISIRDGKSGYSTDRLATLAALYPGRTWIVGNEPDIAAQDWATPEEHAAAYHAVYETIKQADANAILVAGNISQVTPLRLRYLDSVLAAYRRQYGTAMPVDVWGVHLYVLPEKQGEWGAGLPPGATDAADDGARWTVQQHDDLAVLEMQVRSMRGWMAANGYTNHPLWITEYGILMPASYGFQQQRVVKFMIGSFDLFQSLCDTELGLAADGRRMVQRWNWFSTRAPEFPSGDLFAADGQPTTLMRAMAQYLAEHRDGQMSPACE